jgi:hypothetical protein
MQSVSEMLAKLSLWIVNRSSLKKKRLKIAWHASRFARMQRTPAKRKWVVELATYFLSHTRTATQRPRVAVSDFYSYLREYWPGFRVSSHKQELNAQKVFGPAAGLEV